jgi:hypothetical protein
MMARAMFAPIKSERRAMRLALITPFMESNGETEATVAQVILQSVVGLAAHRSQVHGQEVS